MSEKVYTEKILAMLIEVANEYVDEPDVRRGIVSKCHQEIGMLITGAPGKNTIDMGYRESKALKTALHRRQIEKRAAAGVVAHGQGTPGPR
jgi:hypothetical protein